MIIVKKQGKVKNNANYNIERNMNCLNQFRLIMDRWQQYSPIAWSEMYDEYFTSITSMTEIYKEYIKRLEKMRVV